MVGVSTHFMHNLLTRVPKSAPFERDRLQRHGADAALGLGALDPPVPERPPHVDDPGVPVDVALLERDPLPRA